MAGGPECWRLFIAFDPPPGVKARMAASQTRLKRELARSRISWVRPEQFHLTLRFLGEIEASLAAEVAAAMERLCREQAPLRLRVAGIGCFPDPRRPRVIWIGVTDTESQLPDFQSRLEAGTTRFSPGKAGGRFTGHLTIARIRRLDHHEAVGFAECIEQSAAEILGEWLATELLLMRSQFFAGGVRHSILAAIRLRAAGAD